MIGNKDIDRKLLNKLDDKDLVNMFQVNKKIQSLSNDQVFWMNRVFLKYPDVPGNILRKNKDKYWNSWSEYYIKDLRKINSTNFNRYIKNGLKNNRVDHALISLKLRLYYNNIIQSLCMQMTGNDRCAMQTLDGVIIPRHDDILKLLAGHLDKLNTL